MQPREAYSHTCAAQCITHFSLCRRLQTADGPHSRVTAQKAISPESHSSRLARHLPSGVPRLCENWGRTGFCNMDSASSATGACPNRHYFISDAELQTTHGQNAEAAAGTEGCVLRAIAKREALLHELQGMFRAKFWRFFVAYTWYGDFSLCRHTDPVLHCQIDYCILCSHAVDAH